MTAKISHNTVKTLILYLTRDGQTRKIAEYIANQLNDCQCHDLRASLPTVSELATFDRIIIGASIRYGHFDPILTRFTTEHADILNQKISAFFSVNLTARKATRNTPETNGYTRKLLAKIAWQPDLCGVFAGALFYPRYRWFDRKLIQLIMKITGGETDTRKEVEYTDWQAVDKFTKKFSLICLKN